jgi:hypothetical protein
LGHEAFWWIVIDTVHLHESLSGLSDLQAWSANVVEAEFALATDDIRAVDLGGTPAAGTCLPLLLQKLFSFTGRVLLRLLLSGRLGSIIVEVRCLNITNVIDASGPTGSTSASTGPAALASLSLSTPASTIVLHLRSRGRRPSDTESLRRSTSRGALLGRARRSCSSPMDFSLVYILTAWLSEFLGFAYQFKVHAVH